MASEKWAQNVKLKKGKLKEIGWPSRGAIASSIRSGKVDYATAIRRLNFIANMGNKKAKSMIVSLQREFKDKKKDD